MNCKNKIVFVDGIEKQGASMGLVKLQCIITNDRHGKTLSINDGHTQFTIPFEQIEKYLKGGDDA